MKTAVTVLQEMMIKLGQTPEYECIAQTGPMHLAMFEYRCKVCGLEATATARSKKEAKQEVARVMLRNLSLSGHTVPPPYSVAPSGAARNAPVVPPLHAPPDLRSYVALLKELCQEFRLAAVKYELVGDTGPPHLRHFTVRARLGQHERLATATTKKLARQIAAENLYSFLRENLARVTRDFNEEEALMRAHEKAMERYDAADEPPPRRPDLGQRIADYHLGLAERLDGETRARVEVALAARDPSPRRMLTQVAQALQLDVQYASLPRDEAPLHVVSLQGAAPPLSFAADTDSHAAAVALRYVRRALRPRPPLAAAAAAAL